MGLDIMQDPFKRFFQRDSFYEKPFFEQNYFMQQFERNRLYIDEMIKQMNSLRNHLLKKTFPELDHNKNEPERKEPINL